MEGIKGFVIVDNGYVFGFVFVLKVDIEYINFE